MSLAACGDAGRGARRRSHLLADEIAAARGLREAPAATVNSLTRYVVTELSIVSLVPEGAKEGVEVGPEGTIEVTVTCPETLADRQIVARLTAQALQYVRGRPTVDQVVDVVEEVRCPMPGEPSLRMAARGLEPGLRVFPAVLAFQPPAPQVESPWLTLPPGARLRCAIGIASPQPAELRAASRFIVRAEGRSGGSAVVFDRILDPARRAGDRPWVGVKVPLGRVTRRVGAELRLIFETETVSSGSPKVLAFPAWGDPVITVPAPPNATRRRNIILVSIDTLRADRLGCYGFPQPTSPDLDRFAARGTLFEQAIAAANWTTPSHATMLTGVLPCVHGTRYHSGPLPTGITPLAEILRRQGYTTAAFTEDVYVDPVTFQRGFDSFNANTTVDGDPVGLVEDTVARSRAWIEGHAHDEFFLFVHTYQVHAPYTPPPRYRELLGSDERAWPAGVPAPSREAAEDAALYAAEVRYTDEVIGRLIDDLDALGLAERTILVVTSDHGEAFGEHGQRFHGGGLYEEQVHVPLLWAAPGLIAPGRRVPDVVGLVDIVPTILDLLEIPTPEWVQGVSLRPFMTLGVPPIGTPAKRVLSCEKVGGQLALRAASWKAIYEQATPTLFFLATDPQERDPKRLAPPPFVEEARRELQVSCTRASALVGQHGLSEPGQPMPAARDPERERKLRALGYVE